MSGLLTSELISRRMLPSLLAISCALSLGVSPAPAEEAGGTAGAANGYPLTRLILDTIDRIPFGEPQSFPSVEAVENYFGMGTPQATLASDFFANGAGRNDNARLKFVRFVPGGGRPRLFGPDLSSITLSTVQALDGATLSFTQNGFTYNVTLPSNGAKAPSNIADPCTFPPTGSATANCLYDLANDIQLAANSSAPQAGTMSGSSIAAASSSLVGTISRRHHGRAGGYKRNGRRRRRHHHVGRLSTRLSRQRPGAICGAGRLLAGRRFRVRGGRRRPIWRLLFDGSQKRERRPRRHADHDCREVWRAHGRNDDFGIDSARRAPLRDRRFKGLLPAVERQRRQRRFLFGQRL